LTIIVTMRQLQSERSTRTPHPGARRVIRTALYGAIVVLAGCRDGAGDRTSDRDPRTTVIDSVLSRDLTLAANDAPARPLPATGDTAIGNTAVATTSATTSAAAQTTTRPSAPPAVRPPRPSRAPAIAPASAPPAPAAVAVAPAPTPGPAPAPARSLAAGTALPGKTNAALCSLANRPGDRLVATLSAPVTGPDGATLAAGTPILVEMAPPTPDGRFAFRLRSVQVNGELVPVEGTVRVSNEAAVSERQVSKGGDQGKIVTGAILGAIAGRVLGGDARGTIIGAAGGAAAGTIASARNTQTERCLPAGATLTITLSAPLVVP
jgi:hypothetical protein